jgi:hypothetical protein
MKKLLLILLAFIVATFATIGVNPKTADAAFFKQRLFYFVKASVLPIHSNKQNAVTIHFYNLRQVEKVTYTLTYTADGVEQGISGSFSPDKNSETRKLFLGTCSQNVCTPHKKVRDLRLEIHITYKNGSQSNGIYKILSF